MDTNVKTVCWKLQLFSCSVAAIQIETTVPPGQRVSFEQVVGVCGESTVRTEMVRVRNEETPPLDSRCEGEQQSPDYNEIHDTNEDR